MKSNISRQSGVVLMVSMVILFLLTIIVISGVKTTIMEEKMAGNYKDQNIAFQAAEAGLLAGERFITEQVDKNVFTVAPDHSDGLHLISENVYFKDDAIWTDAKSANYVSVSGQSFPAVKTQPKFYIEHLTDMLSDPTDPSSGTVSIFRVTARGTGKRDTTRVFLRSHYKHSF